MTHIRYLSKNVSPKTQKITISHGNFFSAQWIVIYLITSTVLFFLYNPAFADKASTANKQGIKAFSEQKYEESVEHFTEALVESPETPELKFNRGTALSALGKNEEAAGELLSSASGFKNNEQSAAAHFNAGNTFLASNNIEAAIQEYKQAAKLDQVPEDIRHNLELALRKQNQQQQSQEQDKQNGEDKEKKEDKEGDQQKNKEQEEEQDKKDEQQSDKTQSPKDGEQKDQNQQPSNQQQNEVKPMTQDEAKRLLDAINDEEKRALSQRYMQMKSDMRQGDDW